MTCATKIVTCRYNKYIIPPSQFFTLSLNHHHRASQLIALSTPVSHMHSTRFTASVPSAPRRRTIPLPPLEEPKYVQAYPPSRGLALALSGNALALGGVGTAAFDVEAHRLLTQQRYIALVSRKSQLLPLTVPDFDSTTSCLQLFISTIATVSRRASYLRLWNRSSSPYIPLIESGYGTSSLRGSQPWSNELSLTRYHSYIPPPVSHLLSR